MIKTFTDKKTAALFLGLPVKQLPPDIRRRAKDKLDALDAATHINDLLLPPSNRLETLQGDRSGSWSLRINDQWRICFRFDNGNAFDVEIVDHH